MKAALGLCIIGIVAGLQMAKIIPDAAAVLFWVGWLAGMLWSKAG